MDVYVLLWTISFNIRGLVTLLIMIWKKISPFFTSTWNICRNEKKRQCWRTHCTRITKNDSWSCVQPFYPGIPESKNMSRCPYKLKFAEHIKQTVWRISHSKLSYIIIYSHMSSAVIQTYLRTGTILKLQAHKGLQKTFHFQAGKATSSS